MGGGGDKFLEVLRWGMTKKSWGFKSILCYTSVLNIIKFYLPVY